MVSGNFYLTLYSICTTLSPSSVFFSFFRYFFLSLSQMFFSDEILCVHSWFMATANNRPKYCSLSARVLSVLVYFPCHIMRSSIHIMRISVCIIMGLFENNMHVPNYNIAWSFCLTRRITKNSYPEPQTAFRILCETW